MLDLLVGLLIIIFIASLVGRFAAQTADVQQKKSANQCPPHKWTYQTRTFQDGSSEEYMVCDLCKLTPGQIPVNYDKPY